MEINASKRRGKLNCPCEQRKLISKLISPADLHPNEKNGLYVVPMPRLYLHTFMILHDKEDFRFVSEEWP